MSEYYALSLGEKSVLKWGLKRRLRRAYHRSIDLNQRKALEKVLRDEFLFDLVLSEAFSRFAVSGAMESDTPFLDRMIRFFEWIIENWDSIIEIITTIIGLFGDE